MGPPALRQTLVLLWLVQFLSGLAMTLGLIFVPFYLVEDPIIAVGSESARLWYTALIFAGPFVTTIIATPLWGAMADRSGRKRQVVRAAIGLGITQVLMGVAQTADQLVIIRMLQGAISGVVAANLALLSAATPLEQQGRVIARLQTANPAGQIIGPVLGGLLAATLGYRQVYWLLGCVTIATGLGAWLLLREPDVPRAKARIHPVRGLLAAGRRALREAPLRSSFGILFIGQLAWTVAQVVFAIYAGKVIASAVAASGMAPAWWNSGVGFTALCSTLVGVANFLTLPWWGKTFDRGVRTLPALSGAGMAVAMLLFALWPPWWFVLVARAGVGVSVGGTYPLQYAAIAQCVAPEERGQFMGLATSVMHLGNLIGFIAGGALGQLWGESGNFVLSAALYLTMIALSLHAAAHLYLPKPATTEAS